MQRKLRKLSTYMAAFSMLAAFLLIISSAPVLGQAEDATSGAPVNETLADTGFQAQPDGIDRLMADTGGTAKITVDPNTGVARFIQIAPDSLALSVSREASAQNVATAFLTEYGSVFGIANQSQLRLVDARRDQYGKSQVIYQQVYDGVEVFAGILKVHLNERNAVTAANGVFLPKMSVRTTPDLLAEAAAGIAVNDVLGSQAARNVSTDLAAVNSHLYVYRAGLVQGTPGRDHLVYEVEVANPAITVREFVYVDAHTGAVVNRISGIHEGLNREVSENNLANVVWVEGDPDPIPGGWAGGTAQQVFDWQNEIDGASETYHIFASMGGWDSYDNAGATMRTVNNDPAISCPNANWNGTSTNYCSDVTGDDTVAHEWGHAYMDYTSNLIYQWQSGALNESYSDIWGDVVDLLNGRGIDAPDVVRPADTCSSNVAGANFPGNPTIDTVRWLSGEDDPAFFGIPSGSGNAIRDMWDPTCFGDPGKVTDTEYHCSTTDGGGVHTNSGVPNHAFALLVDGGTYNGQTISAIGLTKAAHIHWGAQNILTPADNFVAHADALEASCSALIGIDLPALSTSDPSPGLSGEVISAADCQEVTDVIAAVEFRLDPTDQCGFVPMLDPDAPALCEGFGAVESIVLEDWEGGTLPAGWTVGTRDVADPATFDTPDWAVVGSLPGRAGMAAFVEDNPLYGDCAADTEAGVLFLESPVIPIPVTAEVPRVAVDHWVATELGWDGGNIKVSVNGGAWTLVPSSAFDFNPYPGNLNGGGNDNPMAGEEAFTGTDGGSAGGSWGQSQVTLFGIAAPGDDVQLRFEMGLDGCNGVVGWYIDEVEVYSCELEEPGLNCGNSMIDPGETCDDGNTDNGDGCSDICLVEDGWTCTDPAPGDPNGANAVADFSFEGGYPNADWTPSSTFGGIDGFPLCGPDNGCPAAGLGNGDWLVWIGGIATGVTSDVEQSVTIPATATDLTLLTLRGICDDPSDTLHVSLDGSDIGTVACDAVDGDFVQQTFSVAGYADDAAHTLNIGGTVGGINGTHSNIFVDDVTIYDNIPTTDTPSVCTPIATEPFACNSGVEGFESGGLPVDWSISTLALPGGEWVVSTDNSSGFWDPGPAPEGSYYASANDDLPGSGSDGSADYLYTNVIDLSTATAATLDFQYHFNGDYSHVAGGVQVSPDGGATWDPEIIVTAGDTWQSYSLDLSAYLGNPNVQVRFHSNDGGFWASGYAVDDISLNCEIPATLTCNGPAVGFEDGAFPFDWYIETLADPGGEWLVSTDNSSTYWTIPPAPEGVYYASANDDFPGSGSDGSMDYLYTNIIDLSSAGSAALDFQYFFDGVYGQAAGGVQVSPDGGATWDPEVIVPTGTAWESYSLDLSAYAGNPDVQVRFHADDGGFWASGYAVDNVMLGCGDPAAPIIDVDPGALSSTLPPDDTDNQVMTISNLGDADLNWYIEEAEAVTNNAPSITGGSVERLGVASPIGAKALQDVWGPIPGVDVVTDGGFEAGPFGGTWNEFSLNFGTPICDIGGCGTGTGTGPNSGTYWAWFGGIATYEEGSVSQDVTFPASGVATLSFYLEQIVCDSAADYLEVTIDGTQVFYSDGSNPICGSLGYSLQTVDVGAFADGGTHALEFHSEIFANNGSGTNFFVDDVMLDADEVPPTGCAAPTDLPWVSAAPDNGTVAPLDAQTVDVTFDSTGLTPGLYEGTLCVHSNDPVTPLVEVPVSLTVEVTDVLYLSSNSAGSAGGVDYVDEDIVAYDVATGDWSLVFDGSDMGLRGTDIDALHMMDDGSILMSFNQRVKITGFGNVRDEDIVKFIPTSLGDDTAGSFERFFDGSDVGLRKAGEDVDAIGFAPDGRLVVSTNAALKVPQTGGGRLQGSDDDLIVFNGTLGADTVGDWEMYFDGSDLGLLFEDVWGAWLDADTGDVYLSMQNAFTAGGVSGDELDVIICHPDSLGADTACTFEMYFDGSAAGFGGDRIDGFAIDR